MGHTLAAIDLGTNSVLLSVIEVDGATPGPPRPTPASSSLPRPFEFRSLHEEARVTRLGRGVDESGELAPDSIERTLECLRDYRRRCGELGVERLRIVGTSAVRDARNGGFFRGLLEEELGLRLEVVSGTREAELTFRGALVGIAAGPRTFVFDIGGGSTEFILGEQTDAGGDPIRFARSLDVGSVRMHERARLSDPPTEAELRRLAALLDDELERLGSAAFLGGVDDIIGVAGTVTSLAALALGLDHYDRSVVHGARVELDALERTVESLARLSVAERRRLTSLETGRADVIVVGGYWLLAILRWLGRDSRISSEGLLVSDRGVRFGLLAEMAAEL